MLAPRPRARTLLATLAVLASCKGGPAAPDLSGDLPPLVEPADGTRVAEPRSGQEAGAPADLPAVLSDGPLPCPQPPCPARPILFVHGFCGSNDDWLWLMGELAKTDPRYDGHRLAGREDHAAWPEGSIPRRDWLFAFDYYVKTKTDPRGSYTAGPGRIGSNAAHGCSSPAGKGYIIPDSDEYDQGVTHDYAQDLAAFVESVLRATRADSVDLVAHSMGGLIVRSYLSFHAGAARVKRVLLLASPVTGVPLAGLYSLVPFGHPAWMNKHEIAEIDGGSSVSPVRFVRCDEIPPQTYGAWGQKVLDYELAYPPSVELHLMNGTQDVFITYQVSHHPLALSHLTVPADHPGILERTETLQRVAGLLGGSYP